MRRARLPVLIPERFLVVRMKGIEPPRISPLDPKSNAYYLFRHIRNLLIISRVGGIRTHEPRAPKARILTGLNYYPVKNQPVEYRHWLMCLSF